FQPYRRRTVLAAERAHVEAGQSSGKVILNEKLTAAEQRRRPCKVDLVTPFDALRSSRSMHPQGRSQPMPVNGSHRRRTRPGTSRPCLAHAALPEAHRIA